jgi:PAS domain S-box-containing protein/putative nucleotidyltransferase with HDIG domain
MVFVLSENFESLAGMGTWTLDLATSDLAWSPGMYVLFDVDPETTGPVLQEVIATRIHPDDRALLEDINARALAEAQPIPAEYRIQLRDGGVRWVRAVGEQVLDEAGDAVALRGFVQDITDSKRQQAELEQALDKFQYIFDHSCIAKSITKPTGEIEVNEAFLQLVGYTRDELSEGTTWQQLTHPDDIEYTNAFVESLLAGFGQTARFEKRYIRKDGSVVWADLSTSLRREPDGTPSYFMTAILDVTQRKKSEQALERSNRALRALSASNELLLRADSEPDLLQGICDVAVGLGSYMMAWVGYAQDDERRSIKPLAHAGQEQGFLDEVALTWSDDANNPSGRAIREGKPCLVRDAEGVIDPLRESVVKRGFGSVAALPLLDESGRAFGVIVLVSGEPDAFDEEEMTLLEEMASDVAFGVRTIRMRAQARAGEAELAQTNERLEQILHSLTRTLGRVVETRDPYTQGHEIRVAELARAIAQEMGMDHDELDGIEAAALVHDVGKLSVPAEILTKPGLLSVHEFELIKDHSRAGYQILEGIPFQWPVADIALQHHERMDGSGYPSALRGEEIVLGARIVAVADVVEAMSSHRPYRAALGLDAAMEELASSKGKYDPDVVAACVRLFEAGSIAL